MTTNSESFYTACKVCQSPELATLYTSRREKLPILSCRSCGLFFVGRKVDSNEQRSLYQDEVEYLAYVDAERSVPQVSARYRKSLNQIWQYTAERFGKREVKLLDIGCGAGDFLSTAKNVGFKAYGLEVSTPAARLAAETHNI